MLNMIFIRLRGKFHEEKCWASLALIIAKMEKRFLKKKNKPRYTSTITLSKFRNL